MEGLDLRNNPAANSTISIFSLPHIEQITSLSFKLSHSLFKSIISHVGDRQLGSLTVLRLNVLEAFFQDLLDFLTFCPNLKKLYILQTFDQNFPPPMAFSSAALQSLEEFMGPMTLAEVIVPGRPIHTIHLFDHLIRLEHDPDYKSDFSLEDLKILGDSSAHITTLSISISEQLASKQGMEFIARFFPHLRSLELVTEIVFGFQECQPEVVADKDRPINTLGLPLVEPMDEADKLGTQVYVQNLLESVDYGYEVLIYGVALGKYPLPNKIKRLNIRPAHFGSDEPGRDSPDVMFFKPFTFSMMRRIVDALSTRYLDLANVKLGYHTNKWRLGWEKSDEGSWLLVEMPKDLNRSF
ncbi:hypothetical protein CPB83DRAFT_582614 [Crepidotus variabilis]|uniref:Uncharacterized protein n=1 Tax=Crepidotus variabilis TaxID=179855 RepID=A0A9P6JT78_9AGAR|nr:hypothetical protein CPB83DRAFT_582614 [Crepidotus variabilis]